MDPWAFTMIWYRSSLISFDFGFLAICSYHTSSQFVIVPQMSLHISLHFVNWVYAVGFKEFVSRFQRIRQLLPWYFVLCPWSLPSTSEISTLVIFLAQKYHNKKPLILKKFKKIFFNKCKLKSQLSKHFYNYFLRITIF